MSARHGVPSGVWITAGFFAAGGLLHLGAALYELHQLSIDLDARRDPAEDVAADRLPVRAAAQCFLNAYQCVRRPDDAERLADAEIMLRACEHVLERGLA